MISGTNQLLSLKNKQSKNLPGSASIPTLEHHTYRAVLLVPPLAMQARDAAGANATNMVKILSKLFYTINIQELFWTRPKPSQQGAISRSSSHHIENKIETKWQNKSKTKKMRKQLRMWSNSDLRWDEVRWKKKGFFEGSTPVLSFTS